MAVDEIFMERMTWQEVADEIEGGRRTAVIVAGATEQHGPHLPIGTDELLGVELGARVARELGDALVAPVIRPGCSDIFLSYPGTISVSPELLMAILDAYVASLRGQGFRRFVVFPTHGGNFRVLDAWRARGVAEGVIVVSTIGGYGMKFAKVPSAIGNHSDLMETSNMLVIDRSLVHLERAAAGYVGPRPAENVDQHRMRELSPNGVLGDPAGASATIGHEALGLMAAYVVGQVRAAASSA